MPLQFMARYTRAIIRAHPDWLFVFGDNFARAGYGGQAKEARGEPNAVGIPTKRAPSMRDDAFLTDADLDEWNSLAHADWFRLVMHIRHGGTAVWPMDGIGSGLAQLQQRAPTIAAEIDRRMLLMKNSEICQVCGRTPAARWDNGVYLCFDHHHGFAGR